MKGIKDMIFHTHKSLSFSKEIVNSLPSAIKKRLPGEITVIAVPLKESLKLNRRYRNKRKPANVLSFLYPALSYTRKLLIRQQKVIYGSKHHMGEKRKGGVYGQEYGEIILCPTIIKKDAKEQGNTQVFQMTWMVVHGMLHLAGLHHEKSKVMTQRVIRIENAVLDILFNTNKETKS